MAVEKKREVETVNPPAVAKSPVISLIERAASDPTFDVQKFRQLIEMREREESRTAERGFDMAMSLAQAEMRAVGADAANLQTKSRYASYYALDKALRPIYTRYGFSLSFNTGDAPELSVRVICRVAHRDGYGRDYHIDMPADGKGAKGGDVMTKTHATGSAVTYGMRYLLKMIFNVAIGEDDDDGNRAGAVARISDQQATVLYTMLSTDKAVAMFCKKYGIDRIELLPADKYMDAVEAIKARTAAMEEARAKKRGQS